MIQKRILKFGTTFIVFSLLLLLPIGYITGEDSSGGDVTINNASASMNSVVVPSSVDVNTYFFINASVSDSNTLNDIANITYYIYNSNDSSWDGADGITKHYTITYINSTDTFTSTPSGYVDSGGSIVPSDKTQVTGVYKAKFKFSTVAHYVGNYWYVRVEVNDSEGSDVLTSSAFTVNKYFSVDISEASFSFGSVTVPSTDNPITTPVSGYLTITAIANYNYTLQLKRSTWSSLDSKFTITRDTGGGTVITTSYVDWKVNQAPSTTESGVSENLPLFLDVADGVPHGSYTFTLYCGIGTV
ncbi:MAG: hypothetical protein MUP85_25370 [Candidatus Lokiarchaeota archaeon]|nr:hypothetical protein [Candidatus Lokiarchaeota archaeon]